MFTVYCFLTSVVTCKIIAALVLYPILVLHCLAVLVCHTFIILLLPCLVAFQMVSWESDSQGS